MVAKTKIIAATVPITGTHLLGLEALWLTTGRIASACALMTIATNYAAFLLGNALDLPARAPGLLDELLAATGSRLLDKQTDARAASAY
jgi:hypothetical protein